MTAKAFFIAAIIACGGLSASAQQVPVVEGCEAIATVLKGSCAATTIQRCPSVVIDDTYIEGKRIDRHIFDDQWGIAGYAAEDDEMVIKVDRASSSKSSLEELLKNGSALSSKSGTWSTGIIKNRPFVLDEVYTLSDDITEISGMRFRKGQITRVFKIHPQNRDLDAIWKFDLFLAEDNSLFFEGRGSVTRNGRRDELGYEPQSIAFPGEPGFRADRSEVGCD